MKISVKLTVLCTLHWFYITLGQMAKSTSRCAAPPAELTKEATIKCIFPADVTKDFYVYHEKETVADCMMVSRRPDCTLKPGYKQDDQMDTNSFTLRIPYFLQNHTGRYSCVLDGYETEECSLSKRTDGTSNEDKAASTVLTIVVPTVGACLVLASVAVVGYVVYKCFSIKKNARKPDDVPTVETGGEAKESCDTPLVERKPTPESTAGQQTDASISLLSETGDRTELREHYRSSNLQQKQAYGDAETCIKGEHLSSRAETSKCLECHGHQEEMQVLQEDLVEKATGNHVASKPSEEDMHFCSVEKVDDCLTSANTHVNIRSQLVTT